MVYYGARETSESFDVLLSRRTSGKMVVIRRRDVEKVIKEYLQNQLSFLAYWLESRKLFYYYARFITRKISVR